MRYISITFVACHEKHLFAV